MTTPKGETFYDTEDLMWMATTRQPAVEQTAAEQPAAEQQLPTRTRSRHGMKAFCLVAMLLLVFWARWCPRSRPEPVQSPQRLLHGRPSEPAEPAEPVDLERRRFVRRLAACAAGASAIALSFEPPTGQLASGAVLGALWAGRAGRERAGALASVAGAVFGAVMGWLAALSIMAGLGLAFAYMRRACCGPAKRLASTCFMLASMVPAVWLLAVLLRLS